jgi:hypothetical protein
VGPQIVVAIADPAGLQCRVPLLLGIVQPPHTQTQASRQGPLGPSKRLPAVRVRAHCDLRRHRARFLGTDMHHSITVRCVMHLSCLALLP